MDARIKGVCLAVLALCSVAANYNQRSRNFVVNAPTVEIARQVAQQAEVYRHKLAVEWLGKPLPAWRYPCIVTVDVGQAGAGGATTFVFTGNSVSDYKMNIQGPLDRILDSVLPHEINHTIFAEHFRRPMPRWADEGAATFVEDESERRRQMLLAMQVLRTNRRIPMRSLLAMMDYPKDMHDTLHMYAEGYVLVELLIQNGGRAKFLKFLNAAHTEGWDRSLHSFYGHRGIDALERTWNQWVLAGCPAKAAPEGTMLASAEPAGVEEQQPSNILARSQAPDREPLTVEDQVDRTDLVALATPAAPRRGTGLQAPPPTRRPREPEMLNKVDLGAETTFAVSKSRQVAAHNESGPSRKSQAPRVVAQAEPDAEEEARAQFEAPPAVRQQRPSRPAASKPALSRTLMTPSLRLDSQPQYGKAQPFPKDEDFVGDVAG